MSTVIIQETSGTVIFDAAIIGTGGATATRGGGFVYVTGAEVAAPDQISNAVYQDAGNSVLQSFSSSTANVNLRIRASYPLVSVNGVQATLSPVAGYFEGLVSVTLVAGAQTISVQTIDADNTAGATDNVAATLQAAAALQTLAFTGGYPGAQTEVKAGDLISLVWSSDLPINALQIEDAGAGNGELITFTAATSGTVSITIPDRGSSPQSLALSATPRDAGSGAFGPTRSTNEGAAGVDGVNVLTLNNLFPTNQPGAITYPATQGALKNSESASVAWTLSDADTVAFNSPTGELQIDNPTTIESSKNVTRLAGTLNETIANVRAVATRAANGAVSTATAVVVIQNVAPTISISVPDARLRSGGNDGTSPQDYVVTLTSNQNLGSAPSLAADAGGSRGSFVGGGFVGADRTWTRSIRVDETTPDEKGTFAFGGLNATNLSGLVQTTIGSGAGYTLGGFVARTLVVPQFQSSVQLGVEVSDFAKVQAGNFVPGGASVKQPIGTTVDTTDGYTIDSVGVNPTSVELLDQAAVAANSLGEYQLVDIEEIV